MAKNKNKKNISVLTDYIYNDIQDVNTNVALDTIKQYLNLNDGSTLPEVYEWEIVNLFSQRPTLMKLICTAFWANK